MMYPGKPSLIVTDYQKRPLQPHQSFKMVELTNLSHDFSPLDVKYMSN